MFRIIVLFLLIFFSGCESFRVLKDGDPSKIIEIKPFGKFYLSEHKFEGDYDNAIYLLILNTKIQEIQLQVMENILKNEVQ